MDPNFNQSDRVFYLEDPNTQLPVWDGNHAICDISKGVKCTGIISVVNPREYLVKTDRQPWYLSVWPRNVHPDLWQAPGYLKKLDKTTQANKCDCGATKVGTTRSNWCSSRT